MIDENDDPILGMRTHFQNVRDFFGKNLYYDFLLAHGVGYLPGPNTFVGPRLEQHNCFGNALHVAIDGDFTYVEGKVFVHGCPLDHAWCIDGDGNVIDPTTEGKGINGYFGVPLKTDYVKKAVLKNGVYGVLDWYYAGKTAPMLFELGLEAGQQWLLDYPERIQQRRRRRKAGA
jgi:hypothetical protein